LRARLQPASFLREKEKIKEKASCEFMRATDPLTFGVIASLLLRITIVACLVPARRATKWPR